MASPCRARTWNLRSTRLWDELEQSSVRTLLHQRKELEDSSTLEKAKLRHETESSKKKSLKLTAEHAKLEVRLGRVESAVWSPAVTDLGCLLAGLGEVQEEGVCCTEGHHQKS